MPPPVTPVDDQTRPVGQGEHLRLPAGVKESLKGRRVLVTGGSGFIGANFLLGSVPELPETSFLNLDALTYAAHPESLAPLAVAPNYSFVRADLRERERIREIVQDFAPDIVFHFAAESHVDRSIASPAAFIETNVLGSFHLLEATRGLTKLPVFHHVSTDEVYGSLGEEGLFLETTPYDPSSPYSASKASSDHLVRAYARTYGLRTRITNCSNNYGPYQFPEKLIPLMILNARDGRELPVYGQGKNVRDWLYVTDHVSALWAALTRGRDGETYNIGGNAEARNIDIVQNICDLVAEATEQDPAKVRGLIRYVPDRPGHDLRYAIDASKIRRECGWAPTESLRTGLARTVRWYLEHDAWVKACSHQDHQAWLEKNYSARTGAGASL